MKIKRKILFLAIVSFMFLASSFVTSDSYAYWASSVSNASSTEVATDSIGVWTFTVPWTSGDTYLTGDLVTNNGSTYRAKTDNPTKEPGVDKGWNSQWTRI